MNSQNEKAKKSLAVRYPELAEEWHPILNKDLTPFDITPYTSKIVWWKTKDGKEFQSPVRYRTSNYVKSVKLKPPETSGKHKGEKKIKDLLKKQSLAVKYPEIAEEWDYEKNEGVKPEDVLDRSGKKFWWICKKNGHSWNAVVINRTAKNSGCPYCLAEERRLINTRPDIAKDFDPVKNKKINLFDLVASSTVKVWWICDNCDKSYKMSVLQRTKGLKCPKCYPPKRKPIPYEKSLEYNYPDVAKEWCVKLNGELTPKDVRPMSGMSVWWECKEDKEHPPWESIIHNRTYNGNGCPTCNIENKGGIKRK